MSSLKLIKAVLKAVLNLFISEYLEEIPPWKKMKEAFSVKLQTEIRFCLR